MCVYLYSQMIFGAILFLLYVSKTIAFTSTQILPNFFLQSQRQRCMRVVTTTGGNLYQSKFATNSIHKIVTTFSLLILLQHTHFSSVRLTASKLASGYSSIARIVCY